MSERGTPIRIVLVGKTGTGKSSTGNTILGREAFHKDFSFNAVTTDASQEIGEFEGRQITVVDTPGVFNSNETERTEIKSCVELSLPGPHVFLLVVRLDERFTPEQRHAVEWIQTHFGEEAAQFTIVLFTHGDILQGRSVESLVNNNDEVRNLVASCGGRCHVFDNLERDNHTQVEELIRKMDAMVNRNGGGHYTNEMYKEVHRQKIRRDWQNIIGAFSGGAVGGGVGGAVGGALVGGAVGAVVGLGIPVAIAAGAAVAGVAGTIIGSAKGMNEGYSHGGEYGGESGGRTGGEMGAYIVILIKQIFENTDMRDKIIGISKVMLKHFRSLWHMVKEHLLHLFTEIAESVQGCSLDYESRGKVVRELIFIFGRIQTVGAMSGGSEVGLGGSIGGAFGAILGGISPLAIAAQTASIAAQTASIAAQTASVPMQSNAIVAWHAPGDGQQGILEMALMPILEDVQGVAGAVGGAVGGSVEHFSKALLDAIINVCV